MTLDAIKATAMAHPNSRLRFPKARSASPRSSAAIADTYQEGAKASFVSPGYRALIWGTIIGANAAGLSIWFPKLLALQGFAVEYAQVTSHSYTLNILASVYTTFGLLSVLALKAPLKFSPVYVMQMVYKAIWLLTTVLPGIVAGTLSGPEIGWGAVFLFYVVLDVLYIPWDYILGHE